jgi:hypothetical protein
MKDDIYVESTVDRPAPAAMRRVSWGAIFAGLAVTVVVQIILTLLGASIGASSIDPLTERNPMEGLATGAGIWMVVSGLIALFSGAFVAGRLSGGPRKADGLLHGVVTFSVAEIAMLLLLTTAASGLIGGAGSMLRGVLRTEQGQAWQRQVNQVMDQAQGAATAPGGQVTGQSGTPAINEPQVRATGDQAARGVAQGALWAFIGLTLGLGVAAWGGWAGTASLPRYKTLNATAGPAV